ncbi:Predicted arabinose efflux permease, MFS family [Bosea sp. 62]|uniref:MFS transporter n=1 Tax=unclassified Bosea (in: a-proteobacteria) TaxID=2653178 RepID=UPI0012547637|nr:MULTISPECIES: MFS transporter [unclassified Bosea (in: a-proteobacteria)]CAD5253037.1 Predicted arabinose efflux permease, MFS family [Bosea sp. 7B]CAD5278310.1 Predicted arabinose efflux permease, MFS family [Bosea sp. 21B]CAD5279379.1 Predicted arabinose efflux permease, MFS family [Bosea sp. 46]VVT59670.1 Predicted arabinose efflux permease, MFS family [Bosea sp. EC-HK365B]VXB38620.1 Predicted arabinose efflux permease, MFS family [Bosea sp. 62]
MSQAIAAGTTPAEQTNIRRAVAAATIGTVIEWFDYALYGAAAGLIINKLFFPQFSDSAGVLAAFATFAVGFFSRPLGGIVISHIGDRFGRKPALIFTIALMGASTVAMGLLPTYAQIGIWAPVLLVVLRLLQGFGAGAEYAGAVTLVAEYVPPERKAYYTAYLQAATVVGIMLATLSFLLVSLLSEETLFGWAWRVPFLASGLLFFVALYIRKHLDETPEYVAAMEKAAEKRHEAQVPLRELISKSPRELLFGFLSVTGHNANAYILSAFSLSYMTNTLGMPRTDALTAVMIATLTGIITTPIIGALADRVGHAKVYLFGAIFVFCYAFPMFALLDTRNIVLCTIALSIGYGIGFGGLASAQGAFLANLFPTRYRFSGIAMTRELNSVAIAGPTPFIAAALVTAGGGKPTYVVAYLMLCCAVTAIAVLAVRSRSYERGSE